MAGEPARDRARDGGAPPGVTRRGEQYTGWRALPASTDPADTIQTVEQAQELLDRYGGEREALRQTHPDRGGNPDEFRRVMRARELLEAAR